MNKTLRLHETSVAEILEKLPQASKLFISEKTACVGCPMARFCTPEDVVSIYKIDRDKFFARLEEFVENPI